MGKLLIRLEKQLKTEHKEDAMKCLKIYNKLKDMHSGHVWESNWNPLVSTEFIGGYPDYKRKYRPTQMGEIFLKGIDL